MKFRLYGAYFVIYWFAKKKLVFMPFELQLDNNEIFRRLHKIVKLHIFNLRKYLCECSFHLPIWSINVSSIFVGLKCDCMNGTREWTVYNGHIEKLFTNWSWFSYSLLSFITNEIILAFVRIDFLVSCTPRVTAKLCLLTLFTVVFLFLVSITDVHQKYIDRKLHWQPVFDVDSLCSSFRQHILNGVLVFRVWNSDVTSQW